MASVDARLPVLSSGQRLGPCVIREVIRRDDDLVEYRATHADHPQFVALRAFALDAAGGSAVKFQRRAEAVAHLKHPNIIRIFDHGAEKDVLFVVCEYIEGSTLRDLLSEYPSGLPQDELNRLFSQIASAVAYAHEQGITHGRLMPENVLLDANLRPVLSRFAVVQNVEGMPENLAYAAPEFLEEGRLTPPCDIYALGALLYEMATGDVPFKGTAPKEVAKLQLHGVPRPPSEINVEIDPRVENVILKALNKAPVDRYESAREMIIDIEQESFGAEYETLSLDRRAVREMQHRPSEVMRFERSRTLTDENSADVVQDSTRLPYIVVGIAAVVVLVIIVSLLLL